MLYNAVSRALRFCCNLKVLPALVLRCAIDIVVMICDEIRQFAPYMSDRIKRAEELEMLP